MWARSTSIPTQKVKETDMSYDIHIIDSVTNKPRVLKESFLPHGGSYVIGGSIEAWLNITYNYGKLYHELWGHGLTGFNGKKIKEVKPKVEAGIKALGIVKAESYWEATKGNAGTALLDLLTLFLMCEEEDKITIH